MSMGLESSTAAGVSCVGGTPVKRQSESVAAESQSSVGPHTQSSVIICPTAYTTGLVGKLLIFARLGFSSIADVCGKTGGWD